MSDVITETASGLSFSYIAGDENVQPIDPSQPDTTVVDLGKLWHRYDGNAFECEIRLTAEDGGGFSVYAPQLPGVVSQGETEEDALENAKDALREALVSYRNLRQDVPWNDDIEPAKQEEKAKWIVVHV